MLNSIEIDSSGCKGGAEDAQVQVRLSTRLTIKGEIPWPDNNAMFRKLSCNRTTFKEWYLPRHWPYIGLSGDALTCVIEPPVRVICKSKNCVEALVQMLSDALMHVLKFRCFTSAAISIILQDICAVRALAPHKVYGQSDHPANQ
jgi:hypothetical protein